MKKPLSESVSIVVTRDYGQQRSQVAFGGELMGDLSRGIEEESRAILT